MRIVSLLPSATEIICSLGLGDRLVGVTHECDFPPRVVGLPKVTHTLIPTHATSRDIDALVRERLHDGRALYTLDTRALERLAPDLIVTQTLCDVCAVAEAEVTAAACSLPGRPRVVNLEPTTLDSVFASFQTVADAAGIPEAAGPVVAGLRRRLAAIPAPAVRPRVLLLEWLDPPFSCGHWSPELVRFAGGDEIIGQPGERSRTLTPAEVVAARPDVVVVACCGFTADRARHDLPALETLPGWAEVPAARSGRVHFIDGNAYFSRPGPRLVEGAEALGTMLRSTG